MNSDTVYPQNLDYLKYFLERKSIINVDSDFTTGNENIKLLKNYCRVLVVGAGGLGCEILKNLLLIGFAQVEVIDMDTIEMSNLNRQFLFTTADIGKYKAEVAIKHLQKRFPFAENLKYHNCRIEDFDVSFYSRFHIVISGLDSIVARRWLNSMLVSASNHLQEKRKENMSSTTTSPDIIPLIDGGTEGLKGNVRVILPGITACIECDLSLFPAKETSFPLCTLAHTPRLPEHCIEYVKFLLWPSEKPFGNQNFDPDNPLHVQWIFEKSSDRGKEFNISGITYRLTLGVLKNIIPAVASTNASIGALCANEAFKLATSCFLLSDNYFLFNNSDGAFTHSYLSSRNEKCISCALQPNYLTINPDLTLQDLIDILKNDPSYQFRSPGLTCLDNVTGKRQTLFIQSVPQLQKLTKPNLKLSLKNLNLKDGDIIDVVDQTSPNGLKITLIFPTS